MLRSVSNKPLRPLRARNVKEKQRRREDILKSAETLWQVTSYRELSMNQVAREAKLAKGTLYLYFDTKEELFLALLSDHLQDWLGALLQQIQETRPQGPVQLADLIIQTSLGRESLRRLLVLLSTVLERNVQPESASNFWRLIGQEVSIIIEHLPFAPSDAVKMLMHTYALAVGWHQAAENRRPASNHLVGEYDLPNFDTEFAFALRAVGKYLGDQP